MADLIVHNVDLPKACCFCFCHYGSLRVCGATGNQVNRQVHDDGRPDWCPLELLGERTAEHQQEDPVKEFQQALDALRQETIDNQRDFINRQRAFIDQLLRTLKEEPDET